MSDSTPPNVLVFHAGALGDFVLTWPLLRALRSSGCVVHVVGADSHAQLAAKELRVRPISAERREVTALWHEAAAASESAAAWRVLLHGHEPGLVVSFVADGESEAGQRWITNARGIPGVHEVLCVGPPGSPARADAWRRFDVAGLGHLARRTTLDGPVVAHIGAGSREKMWPLDRWRALVGLLRDRGQMVIVIAGGVERERLEPNERLVFEAIGGRVLDSLETLAEMLRSAAVFIGADTGPTHLAAQLGVPTLALFGPTDPAVWTPVGSAVRVLAPQPPRPVPMTWLMPEDVRLGLNILLSDPLARAAASK